jgi:hypothetical protein
MAKDSVFCEIGTEYLCIIIQTLVYNMFNTFAKSRHRYPCASVKDKFLRM